MMKIKWFASLTFLTVLAVTIPNLFSLPRQELIAQPQQQELSQETLEDYVEALEDAAIPEKDEVLDNLTAIKSPESDPNLYWDANGRVLVITFEFGLSEFVILLPSDIDLNSAVEVEVNRVFSTEDYCR
jgi:hypothetical protein